MTAESVTRGTVLTSETGETVTTNLTKQEEIVRAMERITAFCAECVANHDVPITEPTVPALRQLVDAAKQTDRTLFALTPARVYLLHIAETNTRTGIIYAETDGV